jgi:hypothetical protein
MVLARDLIRETVAADTYKVSAEPVLLFAALSTRWRCACTTRRAASADCCTCAASATAAGRAMRPISSSALCWCLLDRFKNEVLGSAPPSDAVQARILAHASYPPTTTEDSASLVDLLKADLVDSRIICGTRRCTGRTRCYVCFQPCEGRVRICGPNEICRLNRAGATALRTR